MKKPVALSFLAFIISATSFATVLPMSKSLASTDTVMYNVVAEDSLAIEVDTWYGSKKDQAKLQIRIIAYSPGGQKRLAAISDVYIGRLDEKNKAIATLKNGDSVIKDLPYAQKKVKDYFEENEELYLQYQIQRNRILKRLP